LPDLKIRVPDLDPEQMSLGGLNKRGKINKKERGNF
jgi:hypothetical protein